MLKKIARKFRKKPVVVILSNEEKVKELSEKAYGLFDHMKQAHDELNNINAELEQIVVSEENSIEREIERHHLELKKRTDNKLRASEEILMNKRIQGKLADFIR